MCNGASAQQRDNTLTSLGHWRQQYGQPNPDVIQNAMDRQEAERRGKVDKLVAAFEGGTLAPPAPREEPPAPSAPVPELPVAPPPSGEGPVGAVFSNYMRPSDRNVVKKRSTPVATGHGSSRVVR